MKNQEKAIAALLSSETHTEAARKIGVSDRTLRGYLADPEFYQEYTRRKRQLVSEATKQLQTSYNSAIKALRGIVESETSSENGKISAARALLEYGARFTEATDILERLDSIEEIAKQNNK